MEIYIRVKEKINEIYHTVRKSRHFVGLVEPITAYLSREDGLEYAVVNINFIASLPQNTKISCDVISRQNGKPYISKGFYTSIISTNSMPEYLQKSMEEGTLGFVQLTADDLESLNVETSIPLVLESEWNEIVGKAMHLKANRIRLEDRVLYTLVEYLDENELVLDAERVGAILNITPNTSVELYPLKSVEVDPTVF